VKVCVLGGGIMGNGIAQLAATAGDDAVLLDVGEEQLERAFAAVESSLARFVRKGTLTEDEAAAARGRLSGTTDLGEAVAGAGVVIEAVPEVLDLKRDLWAEVAALAPGDALLGTNTSQLSITSIAAALDDQAARLVGIHFFNPPVLMRLVELIAGLQTEPEVVERARAFAERLGKQVVVCRKDSPGFITSRAYAILRLECVRMLEEGVASAEDIDTALKLGFNFPMGPLELGDMNGLDTFVHAIDNLAEAHGDRFRPTVGLRNMVAANRLGRKTGAGFFEYDESGRRVPAVPAASEGGRT
jgi:3-hydroxybutyryl-CoA dehydrogenase